jgi:predicted permease
MPLAMLPKSGSSRKAESFHARDDWWVMIMARLRPGIREEQARGTLDVIFRQGVAASASRVLKPEEIPHVELFSGGKGLMILRQLYAKPLIILMTVVGLVLLIACANVANLLLARATARQKEISIRLSLGAGRGRLVAQLLTESTLLALLGGAVGLLLAYRGSELLLAIITAGPMQIQLDVHPGLPVLAFTAGVSLLTGILFGLAPALHATRVDLTPALKASAGNLYGAIGSRRLRFGLGKALMVGQVAISLLLLVGAGLFLRTLMNLENVNLGFSPRHILLFGLKLPQNFSKDQRTLTLYKDLLERLQNLPGVVSASLSQDTLLSGNVSKRSISVDGYIPAPGQDTSVIVLPVGPRFFETMGIRVLAGRSIEFRDTDRQPEPNVAVVNEAVARRYYAGKNPVGKQFTWGKQAIQIIGLVGDIKYNDLRQQPPAVVYIPFSFDNKNVDETHFELLAAVNPGDLIPVVRRVVDQMKRNLSLFDVKTQAEQIDEMLYQERMFAKLTSAFGFLAMTLACVGLYGSMAYAVSRRTNEIGIRMALGAQRYSILHMIMGETLLLVMAGMAIGIPVSIAATRALQSVLFGLKPGDPYTVAAASLLMLVVGAFAGYLPARRASRVDPMVALRYE